MPLPPRALRRTALRVALASLLLGGAGAVGEGPRGALLLALSAALVVTCVSLVEQVGQARGWAASRRAWVLGGAAGAAALGAFAQASYLRGLWAGGSPAAGVAALSASLASAGPLRVGLRAALIGASAGVTLGYLLGPRSGEGHEGINVYTGQLGLTVLLSWTFLPLRRQAAYPLLLPQLLIGLVLTGLLAWGAFSAADWIEEGLYPEEGEA